MRVAIIGFSGAGKTTLADALAGQLGVRPTESLDEALCLVAEPGPVVLDSIPATLEELARIDAASPPDARIEHVLFLRAPYETRAERIARWIVASNDPTAVRRRMLHPIELQKVHGHLESSGRLVTIDASRSRSEVLADALASVGIRI